MMDHSATRWLAFALVITALLTFTGIVEASNAVTGLQEEGSDIAVPTWLYLLTGGAVVGASGLLSMLVTDREFIDTVHSCSQELLVSESVTRSVRVLGGTIGIAVLALVICVGATGPTFANANFAVLVVFVGGRATLTTVTYLFGNPWPTLNPWRVIVEQLPHGFLPYPEDLGVLPSIVCLLVLLWIEVTLPVVEIPRTLATVVAAYSVYTVAGAVVFSPASWFRYADPVSVWFRYYGLIAPVERTPTGIALRLPGARLRDFDAIRDLSGVGFVVLLVWELTYNGFIVTPPGVQTIETAVAFGVPSAVAYLGLLVGGYALFLGVYWLAARRARRHGRTYLSARYLAFRFALPLLGIAAGYHLAHYFTFALTLSPSLWAALVNPLSPPPNPQILVLPGWIGLVEVAFVLLGHLLAIWAAHAVAFDLFSGRLQAVRSQFPFVVVMVLYTILSLWLLSLPTVEPPYAA